MLRWAEKKDKAAVMKLWAVDFESYEPYYSWYFDNVYRPELTLGDFEDGILVSALQLAPYTLCLHGNKLPICYVVGVITEPAYRGQGRGRALLRAAHEHLREQGYAASLLYTDIPELYAPLGYKHCYQQQTLCWPVQNQQAHNSLRRAGDLNIDAGKKKLPPIKDTCLHIGTNDILNHIEALAEIYEKMTARYDGYILRAEHNWHIYLGEQICDKARLLLVPGSFYVLYTADPEKLHIIELGFSDKKAAQTALHAALQAAQEADAPRLLWHGPEDAPLLLPDIPAAQWWPRPFVMAYPAKDFSPQSRPLWINEYT